ncbi:MAG: hypothetical protein M0Z35_19800 [Desulfitobacterium hafniense]|nr:hypothetical protein [Desulfitobacterium hafniense]
MPEHDKNYFYELFLESMRSDFSTGVLQAFSWVRAKVQNQKTSKLTDRALLKELHVILSAYDEASDQWSEELEARLKCTN